MLPSAGCTGRSEVVLSRRSVLATSVVTLTGCSGLTASPAPSPAAFPSIAAAGLSAHQRALLGVLRTEFAAQPPGTKYSEGVEEAWCADFVSWCEKTAGSPLKNPNGGGWRIPGTMTLLDHLRATGVWHPLSTNRRPVFGDIAIYDGNGPFGQHTNFVLGVEQRVLTTIGGNERAAPITVSHHPLDASLGLLGFGHRP